MYSLTLKQAIIIGSGLLRDLESTGITIFSLQTRSIFIRTAPCIRFRFLQRCSWIFPSVLLPGVGQPVLNGRCIIFAIAGISTAVECF